ncbi:unnamed protein product [Linum trigynum]|uniref:Uncharacterized protein n=1 Tax=Linum trigynum TaxID=586398 RepID=A0AAV2DL78_9ROSI
MFPCPTILENHWSFNSQDLSTGSFAMFLGSNLFGMTGDDLDFKVTFFKWFVGFGACGVVVARWSLSIFNFNQTFCCGSGVIRLRNSTRLFCVINCCLLSITAPQPVFQAV